MAATAFASNPVQLFEFTSRGQTRATLGLECRACFARHATPGTPVEAIELGALADPGFPDWQGTPFPRPLTPTAPASPVRGHYYYYRPHHSDN